MELNIFTGSLRHIDFRVHSRLYLIVEKQFKLSLIKVTRDNLILLQEYKDFRLITNHLVKATADGCSRDYQKLEFDFKQDSVFLFTHTVQVHKTPKEKESIENTNFILQTRDTKGASQIISTAGNMSDGHGKAYIKGAFGILSLKQFNYLYRFEQDDVFKQFPITDPHKTCKYINIYCDLKSCTEDFSVGEPRTQNETEAYAKPKLILRDF